MIHLLVGLPQKVRPFCLILGAILNSSTLFEKCVPVSDILLRAHINGADQFFDIKIGKLMYLIA